MVSDSPVSRRVEGYRLPTDTIALAGARSDPYVDNMPTIVQRDCDVFYLVRTKKEVYQIGEARWEKSIRLMRNVTYVKGCSRQRQYRVLDVEA